MKGGAILDPGGNLNKLDNGLLATCRISNVWALWFQSRRRFL